MNRAEDASLEEGAAKLAEGSLDEAVEAFTACLAVYPDEVQALHGRASAYVHMKRWKEAGTDFDAAHALAPDDPDIAGGLALALAAQDQVYPALALFEEVLSRHPGHVQTHIQVGILHLKLGAVNQGKDHLQKALALRPTGAQRRLIEETLKQDGVLDKKRFYRPDFERLRRRDAFAGGGPLGKLLSFFGRKRA